MSFSGQGREIWQDQPPSGRTAASGSVMRNRFLGAAGPGATAFVEPPHKIPPRRGFGPPPVQTGVPIFFFPGFGFFGAGFGLGFGPFGCDPFWGFGCNGFGYFNYYEPYYGFGAPPEPGSLDLYAPEQQPSPSSEYTVPYTYEPPPGPQTPSGQSNETVLYLRDGRVYLIDDYWVVDNQFHYRSADGNDNVVNLGDVDLQATINANASRGIDFTLRPTPNPPHNEQPAPSLVAPPNSPAASRPPAPPSAPPGNTPPPQP